MTSNAGAPPLSPLLSLFYAPTTGDVTFSCPWCSTNLSLPEKDFMAERAVLCPRCNNPIDMEIQRKIRGSSAPTTRAPPTRGAPSAAQRRREVTAPKRREPARREAPPPPPPQNPATADWSKPLDVDAYFGSDRARKSQVDQLMGGWESGRQPGAQAPGTSSPSGEIAPALGGGKITCPSCGFENSAGFDPFRTGPPKCAWCGKPLPQ